MGLTRFAEIMGQGSRDIALDEASLLIAERLQPGLDVIEWMTALDTLAAECPTPTADGVARYLFGSKRFMGDHRSFEDWRNSCLDRVIATQRGIPVTLSILMIEVGRRIGVPLVGINLPNHFLVRDTHDVDGYFDPFDEGRRLNRADVIGRFATIAHARVDWGPGFAEPASNREIVVRTLNNLKGVFTRRSDAVRLALVMGLRAEIRELADAESAQIVTATAVLN